MKYRTGEVRHILLLMIFILNDGTNYVYSSRGNLQPTKLTTGRTAGDWQWLDVLKCTQRSSRLLYMVKKGGLCLMEAKTTWHRTRVGWVGSITAWDSDFVHLSASPLTRDDRVTESFMYFGVRSANRATYICQYCETMANVLWWPHSVNKLCLGYHKTFNLLLNSFFLKGI